MITTLQLHQSSRKKRPNLRFLSFLGLTFTLLLDGKCPAEHINPLETESPVNFDLPSVMTVTPVSDRCNEVVVKLRLCALTNPNQPKPTQYWWIVAQPEQPNIQIVDYAPRTETDSELSTGIDTKSSTEKSTSLGFGLTFDYNQLANLRGAGDQATKKQKTVQFQTKATRQAKIASGTINRGKGVYFKWMRTAEQVLDGEKEFQFTLKTPNHWRCGTICLTVIASGSEKQFNFQSASWQHHATELQSQEFVIAIHREADKQASEAALKLSEQEQKLRSLATLSEHSHDQPQWSKLLVDFGKKIEQVIRDTPNRSWFDRLTSESIDPHNDEEIQNLAVETRVAILEYLEQKRQFLALNTGQSSIAEVNTTETPRSVDPSQRDFDLE